LSIEEFHNLYSSPNIIRITKSRWVGHVAHIRGAINAYKILIEKLNEKGNFEDLGVDGRIFNWITNEQFLRIWTVFICTRIGISGL
jgi:hypothetical protein